jgi:hypothetical protein
MKQIGTIRGNVFVLNSLALLLFGVLYIVVYKLVWDVQRPIAMSQWWIVGIAFGAVALIIIHELIHAVVARMMIGHGNVSIRFHLMVAECQVHSYLTRTQYIPYAVAPALSLGLAGVVWYYAAVSVEGKFLAALLFLGGVAGGGGDFWFVARVLSYPSSCLVLDKGTAMEIAMDESGEPLPKHNSETSA